MYTCIYISEDALGYVAPSYIRGKERERKSYREKEERDDHHPPRCSLLHNDLGGILLRSLGSREPVSTHGQSCRSLVRLMQRFEFYRSTAPQRSFRFLAFRFRTKMDQKIDWKLVYRTLACVSKETRKASFRVRNRAKTKAYASDRRARKFALIFFCFLVSKRSLVSLSLSFLFFIKEREKNRTIG